MRSASSLKARALDVGAELVEGFAMPAILDLKQLSRPEKVSLMEQIWQDLSADDQEVESPSWHEKVLADRLAKVEEGHAIFLTIEEVEARLASKCS